MSSPTPSSTGGSDDNRRYHSLDQLRALMMLLGLVIHSSASFTRTPMGLPWAYQDAKTNVLFDVLVLFIHVFRMPLFFLLAGFFMAYLYYRRGPLQMLGNRVARVAVPFVLFLGVLTPLVVSGFQFSQAGGVHGGWRVALAYLTKPPGWYAGFGTLHLWFLYYLILFCLAIVLATPIVERVAGSWLDKLGPRLGRLIHRPLGVLVCITTTFLTLLPMRNAGLDTATSFLVQPRIVLAYGVFVGFGWMLYVNREQVDRFALRAWPSMIAGLVLLCAYLAYAVAAQGKYLLAGKAIVAAAMWTLSYGFIGLFVRYCDHPKPLGRYLADASYWLYLVHLPITIWVPGLMNGWNVPAIVKWSITLSATLLFSLATYHYLVRSTAIGALLNGKRYPRGLPHVVQARAPQSSAQTA